MTAHCANCPNRFSRNACGSEPHDCRKPLLALIGESPSWTDLHEGRPLSPRSAAGRVLQEMLRELNVSRNEVWLGNAVNCDARTGRDLERAQPACASRLMEELAEIPDSAVLVPLGTHALRSILSKRAASILKFRGSVTRLEEGPLAGRLVVPVVHPAFAMRKPAYLDVIRRDLKRALDIQENGWVCPSETRPMHIVRELDELEGRLSELGDEVAFDVETTFDPPMFNDLICFSLSDGESTIVVPWSTYRSGQGCVWEHPKKAAALVTECLRERLTIGHNLVGFDAIVAARYGIEFGKAADTLVAFHAVHGELPKNLGFVASYYTAFPPWKQWPGKSAEFAELYKYNGLDTIATWAVWQGVKQEMGDAG